MLKWCSFISSFFVPLFLAPVSYAFSEVDCYKYDGCIGSTSSRGGAVSSNPSFGNQIRLNPSAVPTDNTIGLEAIYYKQDTDLSLVKGLGRVGAGISPSNNEETFFGPPAIETDQELLDRKTAKDKYKQQKLTLATAFSLFKGKGSGLSASSLQVGVMGKYNYLTNSANYGFGLNGTLGPMSFSYSSYEDQTQISAYYLGMSSPLNVKYKVRTLGAGLYLGSLLLDYAILSMSQDNTNSFMTVRLTNASLLIKKFMITASRRDEDSFRSNYNFSTQALETQQQKVEYFGGLQIFATGQLMVGVLYNYYLLHETSFIGTYFF